MAAKPPVDKIRPSPEVVYLVAGTPRTGTTLLCEAFEAAGAGRPREWFARAQLAAAGLSSLRTPGFGSALAYRDYLLEQIRDSGRDGVAGFKLHWHQLEQLMRGGTVSAVDELLSGRLLPGRVTVVLVTRSPVEAQAVSVLRAYGSGVFAVDAAGPSTILRYDDAFWGPPGVAAAARARLRAGDIYDFVDLAMICEAIEVANQRWRRYLDALAVPVREVSYDDIAGDLVGTANAMLAGLGASLRLAPGYRPSLVRQRDAETEKLISRFRADRDARPLPSRNGRRRSVPRSL